MSLSAGFPRLLYCLAFVLFLGACEPSKEELLGAMILTDNVEEFAMLAEDARGLGIDGIPVLLATLDLQDLRKLGPTETQKALVCLSHLRDMARQGLYTDEEIPSLLNAMQIAPYFLERSLIAAETLQIITGMDVGYNKEFIDAFTEAKEPERQKKIEIWRKWYEENVTGSYR